MASLRVAMKLSMAEAKPSPPKDTDTVSSGRKRSASTGEASVSSAGNKSKRSRREPKEGRGSGSSSVSVSTEEQDEDDWDHGKDEDQDTAAEHREPAQSEASPEPSSPGKRKESREKESRESKDSSEQRTDADPEAQDEAQEEAEAEAEASGADAAAAVGAGAAQGADAESAKRGKKRRTPSILKSLGLELPEGEAAADDGEEDGRRHGSVRSAAAVAKSKLTSKTAEGDVAKARREKTKTPAQQLEWVQCDRCSKWRSIAPSLNVDLPDQWFCEMNTWSRYNSCEVKEEAAEEEEAANDRTRSRGGKPQRRRRTESEDEPGHHARRRDKDKDRESERARKRNPGAPANTAPTTSVQPTQPIALPAQEATNWVQCNKCSKWRKVPPHIDVESLPDTWFCENNTWNPQYARCSARQETDESSTAADQTTIGGRGRTKPIVPGSGDGLVVNKTCWVRCERKDCQKWRKVPEHIDMSTFPEEWYCHMNTWNPDTAFCEAREESDNESSPPNALILAPNQKVLSYRKILFGTDGKLRVCFSDKNKFNPSIFTQFFSLTQTHPPVLAGRADEDESTKPVRKVSYWWSGAYDESSVLAQITAKSARNQGPAKNEQEDFSRHSEGMRRQPFYMLDAVRRLVGAEGSVPVFSLPKKASKAQRFIEQLSLFQRLRAECAVVRSCFLASQCSNLLFTKLLHMIAHSRFHNPCLDACREFMSAESLKQTLHRMEQNCELEVFQTRDCQLVACLLMSIDNLRNLLASKTDRASKKPFGEKWATPGVPLKMRKFFLKKDHVLQQKPSTVPTSAVEKFPRRPRHTTPKESTPAITRRRASSYKPDEFNEEEQKVLEESNEDAEEEESAVQTETEAIAIATVEQEVRKNLFGTDALTKQKEDDEQEDQKEEQEEEQKEEPSSSMDVDGRKEISDEDPKPDAVDIPLVDEMLVTEAEEKIDETKSSEEPVDASLQENEFQS